MKYVGLAMVCLFLGAWGSAQLGQNTWRGRSLSKCDFCEGIVYKVSMDNQVIFPHNQIYFYYFNRFKNGDYFIKFKGELLRIEMPLDFDNPSANIKCCTIPGK